MTNSDRDHELLEKYMNHLLPEDDERLKKIKQRVGSDLFRKRQKATLKKRANRFYVLSMVCMLLSVGVFLGYRWILRENLSATHAISNTYRSVFLDSIQSPALLTVLIIFIMLLFVGGCVCLGIAIANQKKFEKL